MGRGIAEAFAGWGAAVGVTDIDEAGARATSEAIAAAGGRATSHGVDVADDGSVDVALDAFLDFAGGIDLAINAAAVFSAPRTSSSNRSISSPGWRPWCPRPEST